MTTEFPHLTAMGIRNPDQIVGYSIAQISQDLDVLKINYGRPKGSLLPMWRTYEFKKSARPLTRKDGSEGLQYEISQVLSDAVIELDHLLGDKKARVVGKQELQKEIAEISKEFEARLAHLSQSVESLK